MKNIRIINAIHMEVQFIVHLILTITGLRILTIGNIGKRQ